MLTEETTEEEFMKFVKEEEEAMKRAGFYRSSNGRRFFVRITHMIPERDSRWSMGFAFMGRTEEDGKTYEVFCDRDNMGEYIAIRVED